MDVQAESLSLSARTLPPVDLRLSHLLVQLTPIDQRLQQYLSQARQSEDNAGHAQLHQQIERHMGARHWASHVPDWDALNHWPQALEDSRLEQLVRRFDLSPFERDLLLLCLLPVLDARYRLIFAALQNEPPQNGTLTRALALNVLCVDLIDQIECHVYLAPDAALFREGLLYWKQRDSVGQGISGTLHLSSAVYFYLLGHDALNPELAACGQWQLPPTRMDPFPAFTAQLSQHLVQEFTPRLVLQGLTGSGRAETVARAAGQHGLATFVLDLEALPNDDEAAISVLELALRDIKLRGACLVLRGLNQLAQGRREVLGQLNARLRISAPAIVYLSEPHIAPSWLGEQPHLILQVPGLGEDARAAMLSNSLPAATRFEVDCAALVKRYHLTHASLPLILAEAEQYRQLRNPALPLSEEDLRQACRLRSQQHFGDLARRTEPQRTFADLIVGEELAIQLREVEGAIRQRERVLAQGFGRKVGYGTGISALFHGDSGTGKTMAAEVLAHSLGVDLITIDLSTVVNKYIGETEKNLARIFDLAERDSGVLLFDEADALFGKRSETKDAHDRHANIQVSYLLQRLEKYPGLVILSSNNRTHLDDAFSRRITFMLRFPAPDAALRERMWREIWPAGVQLSADIDFAEWAHKAEISGANIRNIALAATWLAADEQAEEVKAAHIDRALRRELSKIGRLLI